MTEDTAVVDNTHVIETDSIEKTVALFQFIRELNKLKQMPITNISNYPWKLSLSDLPDDHDNIKVYYRDSVESETPIDDEDQNNILLSIHKPEFQKCPEPDPVFKNWLIDDWENYHVEAQVKKFIELNSNKNFTIQDCLFNNSDKESNEDNQRELFQDSEERVKSYEKWCVARSEWASKQKITEQTRKVFTDLYQFYFELQREAETEEIIVANGMLCDRDHTDILHPVLTRRVKIEYDADTDIISIVDTDTPSELYSAVFQSMEDIHVEAISSINEDLNKNDYHPLDRNDTPDFLKILVHKLSSESMFSLQKIKKDENSNSRIFLYIDHYFIIRKRLDGTLKAIENIIEDIQNNGKIPKPIIDIVSGGIADVPDDSGEVAIDEQLAAVGGESIDILLSKEANKEQLDIAKRIEQFNAVLVQGPPGTGKTHTIANLLGHFLAQGKSVLVTSYTKKALAVLKEKVPSGLQNLCVSILDDSNADMERSVDGITSYTSANNSYGLKREMDNLANVRKNIIADLAETRKKIFAIINQECNSIVLNGEGISPSDAAKFVVENSEKLSYIPGKVRLYTSLPLNFSDMSLLYRSNEEISCDDEKELETELPNPSKIMEPSEFTNIWNKQQAALNQIKSVQSQNMWTIQNDTLGKKIKFSGDFGEFTIMYPSSEAISDLKQYAISFGEIEQWMKVVAADGKNDNALRQRWQILINELQKTCACADEFLTEALGRHISIDKSIASDIIKTTVEEMKPAFSRNGKISWLQFMLHKNYKSAMAAIKIDGNEIDSETDCDLVIKYIELEENRKRCGSIWDELLVNSGLPQFFSLDKRAPERIAENFIPKIQKYINWYKDDCNVLANKLDFVGIPSNIVFQKNDLDSEFIATDKMLTSIEQIIPKICDACINILNLNEYSSSLKSLKDFLIAGKKGNSSICRRLFNAIDVGSSSEYSDAYVKLENMYAKYELQNKRKNLLNDLRAIAPQWADAIQFRKGVHGSNVVPSDVEQAWKWKQLCGIVEEITNKPFKELQEDSLRLSREYREITAKYAEKMGWYHLLKRTEAEIDMKQALEGWRLTVKSIGKGTGKRAPVLRAKARELMAKCQNAVPVWIMPINKALESLNPSVNKFDIVIIDEASQADISSLAILYMGKKLIIVGDDCQVSPMAVGVDVDKIQSLQDQYIKDKIPNSHLYTAKTSIYDVAKTTFQPLMLREHFRCVPEIIQFCNGLSYDGKIKPLRDASTSILLPAIINYRVDNGQRLSPAKKNPNEAETIVALMQACFEQPEYDGKSFGVISLLGDEQAKMIQIEIELRIKPKEIISRNILCGNSANFQGDERDVIFLSMVDSRTGLGPIRKMGYGSDEAYRKRYNVAVSRARDQLWVVNSLDSANDLQPGDIRKQLIDYSLDPMVNEEKHSIIEKNSESPFESEVAKKLSDEGYHLVQQWKVGSYRLDIVAVCGEKKVAIECDGERWHSGEEKIRNDMERQTILERLGWRFVRIRGSEFYRDREKTINRVISDLSAFGINPENTEECKGENRNTELLERVKIKAGSIIREAHTDQGNQNIESIALALDLKNYSEE